MERQITGMKRAPISVLLLTAVMLVMIALAAYLVSPLAELRRRGHFSSAPPPLGSYGVDIQQTSVSGVSSGGAMAVQMHVAHSSLMRGIGVIAGVGYDCANSDLPLAAVRLARGYQFCLAGSIGADAAFSISRTAAAAAAPGAIDDPARHLAPQRVWLFSGYNDGTVRRAAMDAVDEYYEHYVQPGNVFYKTNNHAPHALITDDHGGPCLGFNHEYINNCGYDAAGRLLEHIYGALKHPGGGGVGGSILAFDQREFVVGDPALIGLAETGYVYVPATCATQTCRVHVVFHGCKQYAGALGDAFYRHGGYNKWADPNNLVVLYPQTAATMPGPSHPDLPVNPEGCWDWWGLSDNNHDFARKGGYQISAVKAMLDRLAQQFMPSRGSPDSFGPPQEFSIPDNTSASVELIWQPNAAAAGYNVYRSSASGGPYTKVNTQPVSSAGFVDGGLTANTTYFYEIRAIDPQSGMESAPTNPVSGLTAPALPACDPYFSDNFRHVQQGRAYQWLGDTRALGSNEAMGPYSPNEFKQLTRNGAFFYHVAYCP
jgi:poly(3-hydroxybutyrate) depolymerase